MPRHDCDEPRMQHSIPRAQGSFTSGWRMPCSFVGQDEGVESGLGNNRDPCGRPAVARGDQYGEGCSIYAATGGGGAAAQAVAGLDGSAVADTERGKWRERCASEGSQRVKCIPGGLSSVRDIGPPDRHRGEDVVGVR